MQRSDIIKRVYTATSSKHSNVILGGCVFVAALICFAQIQGSASLLAAGLFLFLLLNVWACVTDIILPVLLFFLPWSPLVKLYSGGISFFTIALLLCCIIFCVKNRFSLRLFQIILPAALTVVTLIAKILQIHSISNSYICFFAMLFLFPCAAKGIIRKNSFWTVTMFFACGIITAALSAQQVAGYPNISKFITVDAYLSITRLSGYYGDPNFYSAHITACIAGVMLLLNREKTKIRQISLIVITVLLVYCGLLSASKTFILVIAGLFLIWIPMQLERGEHGSGKFRLFVAVLCAGAVILSSSAFQSLFQIINERFAYASNISELTTGRTELWINYLGEFEHNVLLALLGQGYTNVNLYGRASHNTIIQGVYQFGLIGFPILLAWVWSFLKNTFAGADNIKCKWKYIALMCAGVILPWMVLDILFFDEFFLLPVYAALGMYFSSNTDVSASG